MMRNKTGLSRRGLLAAAAVATGGAVTAGLRPAHALTSVDPKGDCDVLVYGATPAGIAAAVSVARLGKTVILVEHHDHIGGIIANGLTNADISKKTAIGGLYTEFRQRIRAYYAALDAGDPAQPNLRSTNSGYRFEAHVAERIFHQMLAAERPRVTIRLKHELTKVNLDNGRIAAATFALRDQPGESTTLSAPVFIDATCEGDLAAMAGAPYRIGREGRAEYDEPHAGRIYMRYGETEPLPGSTGEADDGIQAYCFRFHVTDRASNRVPIEKPAGYNRDDYKWLLEDIRAGKVKTFRDAVQIIPMPRGKFELNSDHPHPESGVPSESLDLAEENWAWPNATPSERRKIFDRYLSHNVGLIWMLQNDPEMPPSLREDAGQYGWCKDEWRDNNHIPRQLYVRQGRRATGHYVLTQRDADVDATMDRPRVQPASIGVVEWSFDSHGVRKFDPSHPGVREGYTMVKHEPFQIPYGVIVPLKPDNLLVPVACSCSHIAYNALRTEPLLMALGEAAGIAAHLAVQRDVAAKDVPVAELQKLYVERGGVITYYANMRPEHPTFPAFQWLGARGIETGYLADSALKVTRGEGSARLIRILSYSGKKWEPPDGDAAEHLMAIDVARWLKQAGYPVSDQDIKPFANRQLSLAGFAQIVYQALSG